MSGVDELFAFVRRCLDEDEGLARAAFAEHNNAIAEWHEPWSGTVEIGPHEDDLCCNDAGVSRHIVNWDPARVLAEVEATRRILDLIELCHSREAYDEKLRDPADERIVYSVPIARRRLRDVLRLLAQPYAGQDGWREEWRA